VPEAGVGLLLSRPAVPTVFFVIRYAT
jgi:hypothetical protein